MSVVVTERLGRPRSWVADVIQTKLVYDDDPDVPTALCHILPAPEQPAFCGHPWEALVEVPGAESLAAVPNDLRCRACMTAEAEAT
jgi:hypothetical protein